MGGLFSVFLLALGLVAVSPAWAQDSKAGQPDELQIIEFDYDKQNDPPAVNLPPTLQTPPPAPAPAASPAPAPAPVLAPAGPAGSNVAPAAETPSSPASTATPAKAPANKADASPKQEKVITIIGEPETPAAGAQSQPAAGPSDEELLDSLFGPAGPSSGRDVPAKKAQGEAKTPAQTKTPAGGKTPAESKTSAGAKPAAERPAAGGGLKTETPKKVGPKTPEVSPLRPPVSAAPSSIQVEKSSGPSSVKVEKSPARKPAVFVKTVPADDGQPVRLFHDEAAVVRGFNPRRRAVIDPHTRPKPPLAANYPVAAPGLTWADYRNWELGSYYWSLVHTGYQARTLEFATGRPVPINKALIPGGAPQPKNYW